MDSPPPSPVAGDKRKAPEEPDSSSFKAYEAPPAPKRSRTEATGPNAWERVPHTEVDDLAKDPSVLLQSDPLYLFNLKTDYRDPQNPEKNSVAGVLKVEGKNPEFATHLLGANGRPNKYAASIRLPPMYADKVRVGPFDPALDFRGTPDGEMPVADVIRDRSGTSPDAVRARNDQLRRSFGDDAYGNPASEGLKYAVRFTGHVGRDTVLRKGKEVPVASTSDPRGRDTRYLETVDALNRLGKWQAAACASLLTGPNVHSKAASKTLLVLKGAPDLVLREPVEFEDDSKKTAAWSADGLTFKPSKARPGERWPAYETWTDETQDEVIAHMYEHTGSESKDYVSFDDGATVERASYGNVMQVMTRPTDGEGYCTAEKGNTAIGADIRMSWKNPPKWPQPKAVTEHPLAEFLRDAGLYVQPPAVQFFKWSEPDANGERTTMDVPPPQDTATWCVPDGALVGAVVTLRAVLANSKAAPIRPSLALKKLRVYCPAQNSVGQTPLTGAGVKASDW